MAQITMVDGNTKRLVLNSNFDEIERLEPYLDELRAEIGINTEKFSQIRLAVNEAVTNAINHGNKNDSSKKVYISAKLTGNNLIVNVEDEGEGFNPDELDDPLKEENLLKESGRGIFLIKETADQVEFEENATKVMMKFNLNDN